MMFLSEFITRLYIFETLGKVWFAETAPKFQVHDSVHQRDNNE
jgi:hypothetical protein